MALRLNINHTNMGSPTNDDIGDCGNSDDVGVAFFKPLCRQRVCTRLRTTRFTSDMLDQTSVQLSFEQTA